MGVVHQASSSHLTQASTQEVSKLIIFWISMDSQALAFIFFLFPVSFFLVSKLLNATSVWCFWHFHQIFRLYLSRNYLLLWNKKKPLYNSLFYPSFLLDTHTFANRLYLRRSKISEISEISWANLLMNIFQKTISKHYQKLQTNVTGC